MSALSSMSQHGVAPCRKIDSARMRQFAENTTLTFTDLAVEFASSMGTQADSPSGVVVGVHLDSFVVRQPTASQRARAACGVSARGAACVGPTLQWDLAGSTHHVCARHRTLCLGFARRSGRRRPPTRRKRQRPCRHVFCPSSWAAAHSHAYMGTICSSVGSLCS